MICSNNTVITLPEEKMLSIWAQGSIPTSVSWSKRALRGIIGALRELILHHKWEKTRVGINFLTLPRRPTIRVSPVEREQA